MKPKFLKIYILLFIFSSFLTAAPLWAGDTGKIKGVVLDSKTKLPLIGATVTVEGTTLGGVSKPDGSFHILNVPPGTYTVKVVYVGYQTVLQTDIRVSSDATAEANFNLAEAPIEMAPIEVSGRKVIDKYITANQRTISTAQIKNMPVKNVDELLATQVGFVTKNNELHVRGGRAGEVLYMVDGVATRDPLGGLGAVRGGMSISSQNIEEVSVLKGGFDAEYGNTQSAVINIVTKEGNPTATKGYFEFLTDDFGDPKLNKYSFNTDRIELQLNGPDPLVSKYILPTLGIKFLGDKLTYLASFDAFKTDGFSPINKFAPPNLQRQFRQDDLFSWSKFGFNGTGIKIPERMYNQYTGLLKLAYKAGSKKLVFSYNKDVSRYSLFFNPSYETRGDFNLWAYRYTAANVPQYQEEKTRMSLQLTHNLGKNTFYDIQLSKYDFDYLQQPGDPKHPGGGLVPGDYIFDDEWESFSDFNQNGTWDAAEKFWDVNGNGKYDIGEPFVDSNKGKNGIWDPGEPFTDRNNDDPIFDPTDGDKFDPKVQDLLGEGIWNNAEPFKDTDSNGRFDPERQRLAAGSRGIDLPEPFQDGDINLGEPFTDVDKDGIYSPWEPFADSNGNGKWDFTDSNNNGKFDPGEPYEVWEDRIPNGVYDPVLDIFLTCKCPENMDYNRNGRYDGPTDTWSAGVPFVDRNRNGTYDKPNGFWNPGESFVDLNGNGKWDDPDGFYDRGGERRQYYQNRHSTLWTLKFDLTSQLRKEHAVKTGVMLEYNKLSYADVRYPYYRYNGAIQDNGPWPEHGVFRTFYVREPTRGALYMADQLEYGTMIAKLGLRYDFYIQSKDIFQPGLDQELNEVQIVTGEKIVRGRNKISPRLGVSYPITDVAKVYFNYGHYYQLPEFQFMYARGTQGSSALRLIGNFNLDFQKTVSYELGIQYSISDLYRLDLSGFYKDIYGLLNTRSVNRGTFGTSYYKNEDYGRSRGLEIQLDKTYGNYVSGYINYQYGFAYGKNSAEVSNYYASAVGGVERIPLQEYPLDWDIRHQITLNTDVRINKGDHPYLFGLRMPDNWGINILWQYRTGYPFTPTKDFPGEYIYLVGSQDPPKNSKRMPANSKVDLRFNKDFSVWRLNYTFSVWVNNVFNKRNVVQVWENTGRPDTNQNLFGIVLPGDEIDKSPLYYEYGRNIRVGLSMQF